MSTQIVAVVLLHGRQVGHLIFRRGGSQFHYTDPLDVAAHQVLGQAFEDSPGTIRRARSGVPAWFANLLPERNGALRRYIEQALGVGRLDDSRLLLKLRSDLPGAVTLRVVDPEIADQVLRAEQIDDLGSEPDPDDRLRWSSLSGMQAKLSVPAERLSIPVRDRGTWWIAKLPDRSHPDVPTNEYLVMTWLARAGFPVPEPELAPSRVIDGLPDGLVGKDELVYLVPRFDRSPQGAIHIEDFAQVLEVEPEYKYLVPGQEPPTHEGLGAIIAALTGHAGFIDYVRRLVAMVLAGNNDAHLKNWSLIYPTGANTPELSPVYDFLTTTLYLPPYAPFALPWLGERSFEAIGMNHIDGLADHAAEDRAAAREAAEEAVDALREAWNGMRDEAGRFPALRAHVDRRLRTLPLSTGH